MNFSNSFSFRMKNSDYCTNLAFGGILNRHAHLNTHCQHNVPVTVADEICPVVGSLFHSLFWKRNKSLAYLLELYIYFPNIPRVINAEVESLVVVSPLSSLSSHITILKALNIQCPFCVKCFFWVQTEIQNCGFPPPTVELMEITEVCVYPWSKYNEGPHGSMVEALRYKPYGRGFESRRGGFFQFA